MESEGLDDFADPAVRPIKDAPPIQLESEGEIISSILQSGGITQALSEKNALKTIQFGDLPLRHREVRKLQEVIWTTQKKLLTQTYLAPLPLKRGKDYILGGTNGTHCFALRGERTRVKAYMDALHELEEHSFQQELGHRFVHMETKGDAQEMLVLLNMLLKREPRHKDMLTKIKEQVEKRTADLPEGKETYNHKVHVTERQFPLIKTTDHALTEASVERAADIKEFDKFVLWHCNTHSKPAWTKSKVAAFKVAKTTVPCMAFNETHLAVLYQPHDEPDTSVVTVALYRLNDTPARKPCDCFHFHFPKEHFGEQGLLRLHLNDVGILSVSFANGAVVIDTQRTLPTRVVTCSKRLVTATCAYGRERILLGTEAGECFCVNWQTGDIEFSEMTPVIEPIYSLAHSNRRVFMHAASSISGRMNPYLNNAMTHLPTGRLTGFDVCGTLLFSMEKYGSIQVFSTIARNVLFPFTPPKEHEFASKTFCVDLGDKSKSVEPKFHTVPIPPPAYYQSIKAEADRIVAVYPNGLIRMFTISQNGVNWIADELQKKKEKKSKKLNV